MKTERPRPSGLHETVACTRSCLSPEDNVVMGSGTIQAKSQDKSILRLKRLPVKIGVASVNEDSRLQRPFLDCNIKRLDLFVAVSCGGVGCHVTTALTTTRSIPTDFDHDPLILFRPVDPQVHAD